MSYTPQPPIFPGLLYLGAYSHKTGLFYYPDAPYILPAYVVFRTGHPHVRNRYARLSLANIVPEAATHLMEGSGGGEAITLYYREMSPTELLTQN